MKLLLDMHVLLWAAARSGLPAQAAVLISDPAKDLSFSVARIWEIAIRSAVGRPDFRLDPGMFRREPLESDYEELPIAGGHAADVATFPDLHPDAFDRILIARATVEGITLLTADQAVLRYPGPVRSAA